MLAPRQEQFLHPVNQVVVQFDYHSLLKEDEEIAFGSERGHYWRRRFERDDLTAGGSTR